MRLRLEREAGAFTTLDWVGFFTVPALLVALFFPFGRFRITWCNFEMVTGYPCPTCNMTTCFVHLAHGRVWAGMVTSPLGCVLFLFTLYAVVHLVLARGFRRPVPRLYLNRKERRLAWVLVLAAVALNWAYAVARVKLFS